MNAIPPNHAPSPQAGNSSSLIITEAMPSAPAADHGETLRRLVEVVRALEVS